jgi:hypothetical protein
MDTYFVIVIIHILVGFFLIVIGDTVLGDFININDKNIVKLIEEIAEISGFLLVIIAVIKS